MILASELLTPGLEEAEEWAELVFFDLATTPLPAVAPVPVVVADGRSSLLFAFGQRQEKWRPLTMRAWAFVFKFFVVVYLFIH